MNLKRKHLPTSKYAVAVALIKLKEALAIAYPNISDIGVFEILRIWSRWAIGRVTQSALVHFMSCLHDVLYLMYDYQVEKRRVSPSHHNRTRQSIVWTVHLSCIFPTQRESEEESRALQPSTKPNSMESKRVEVV